MNEKTPGDLFAETMCSMYERHDDAFKKLAEQLGAATDESLIATEELFDAIREAVGAVKRLGRAAWKQNVAAWRMRPMLTDTIRKRQTNKARQGGWN